MSDILVSIDPELIDPNPFQPGSRLQFTAEDLADLADIRERGILQPFTVRRVDGARFQQAFGHRRRAAWMLYRPGEPIEVFVKTLDDREMYEAMVVENQQRLDPSPIEKALTLHHYIERFHASQADAGKLFNIRQAAVSNLLRLLRLPAAVQRHVAGRGVPERLARLLVPVAQIFPQDAEKIAAQIAAAEPIDKQQVAEEAIQQLLIRRGRSLYNVPWKKDWPATPISVDNVLGQRPDLSQIPTCAGCDYNLTRARLHHCARPACFDAKSAVWALQHELAPIAKKLGIQIVAPGEKPVMLYAGSKSYDADQKFERAQLMLATRHASLRIIPYAGDQWPQKIHREKLLGSSHAALATVDPSALKKAIAAYKAKRPKDKQRPAKKEKSWNQIQRERMAAEKARQKVYEEMLDQVTPIFAPLLPGDARSIDLLIKLFSATDQFSRYDIETRFKNARTPAEKRSVFIRLLLWDTIEYMKFDDARQQLAEIAQAFKLPLPATWSIVESAKTGKAKKR